MTGFEKRPLGRTSLEVTVLGLGCATLGGHRVAGALGASTAARAASRRLPNPPWPMSRAVSGTRDTIAATSCHWGCR